MLDVLGWLIVGWLVMLAVGWVLIAIGAAIGAVVTALLK